MFNLIRRISYSVIPRADRPWADDATSNAPQTGKKRRLSSTERERDPDFEESTKKKIRGESVASSVPDSSSPQVETAEVKYVTQGVKQVELTDAESVVLPEAIPLPEEEAGELDEPSSATPPPSESQEECTEDPATDDIASSVNGDVDEPTTATVVAEDSGPPDNGSEGITAGAAPDLAPESTEPSNAGKEDALHNDD